MTNEEVLRTLEQDMLGDNAEMSTQISARQFFVALVPTKNGILPHYFNGDQWAMILNLTLLTDQTVSEVITDIIVSRAGLE